MTNNSRESTSKRKPRVLLAKPGLDGHDIGIRVIASKLRDCGMEVIYLGLFQTEAVIVNSALQEDVDLIGLSSHGNDHMSFIPEIFKELERRDASIPIVLGGIIPDDDGKKLEEFGVKAIFQPWSSLDEIVDKIGKIVS